MYHNFCIHSSVDGHLGCFRDLAIVNSPAILLKIALAIWGHLWFHTHFRIVCSISVKNAIEILIGMALNLRIALHSMDGSFLFLSDGYFCTIGNLVQTGVH